MSRQTGPLSLAAIYGQPAAERLAWLEVTAGIRAVHKFMDGKVGGAGYSGQYVMGICDSESGRHLICHLLDELKDGKVIALCDIDSYYSAGGRRPVGMQLLEGKLVDVWAEDPEGAYAKSATRVDDMARKMNGPAGTQGAKRLIGPGTRLGEKFRRLWLRLSGKIKWPP